MSNARRTKKACFSRIPLVTCCLLVFGSAAEGQRDPTFEIELELASLWQTRNDVQIPNDQTGTKFTLLDPLGTGPWPAGRAYLTWNINRQHALRALLAPLVVTEAGMLQGPVSFAGETFAGGGGVEATYRFNSWRLNYRYRVASRPRLRAWVGLTAKLRDAEVRLRQGNTSARDTDLGFVPLLHLAADWRVTSRGHLLFDFDGLAGGPGRAFDVALEFGYDVHNGLMVSGGYRTVEGGADVDAVYAFAWFHYAVISLAYHP